MFTKIKDFFSRKPKANTPRNEIKFILNDDGLIDIAMLFDMSDDRVNIINNISYLFYAIQSSQMTEHLAQTLVSQGDIKLAGDIINAWEKLVVNNKVDVNKLFPPKISPSQVFRMPPQA